MSKYILNISTGKIHLDDKPCAARNKMKKENSKEFYTLEDAVNYYDGNNKTGTKCGLCFSDVRYN